MVSGGIHLCLQGLFFFPLHMDDKKNSRITSRISPTLGRAEAAWGSVVPRAAIVVVDLSQPSSVGRLVRGVGDGLGGSRKKWEQGLAGRRWGQPMDAGPLRVVQGRYVGRGQQGGAVNKPSAPVSGGHEILPNPQREGRRPSLVQAAGLEESGPGLQARRWICGVLRDGPGMSVL